MTPSYPFDFSGIRLEMKIEWWICQSFYYKRTVS